MYNRYTPQPDGSYKRKTITVPHNPAPLPVSPPQVPQANPETSPAVASEPVISRNYPKQKFPSRRPETSAGTFLKELLPKNLDTGDLLIIILLLLMAADGNDDQGSALFTLALYLFM